MPINLILLEKVERKKYKVNIDFDLASKEWRKNKILLGNGMFKYKK
jgi:phosphate-selective porin